MFNNVHDTNELLYNIMQGKAGNYILLGSNLLSLNIESTEDVVATFDTEDQAYQYLHSCAIIPLEYNNVNRKFYGKFQRHSLLYPYDYARIIKLFNDYSDPSEKHIAYNPLPKEKERVNRDTRYAEASFNQSSCATTIAQY